MKTVFTFYKNSQKGQDLVEYALMLAIIIGIGWGIYSQTGVADSIKNVFGNASSLMETAKKNTGTFDLKPVLERLDDMQKGYQDGNLNNGMDYRRGLIQSGWLTDTDKEDSTIGKLASELGATMWTFYNGENKGKPELESGVLYWTTDDLSSAKLTRDGNNYYSQENVLSYRYDPSTGQYSVIENRAWVKQIGRDWKFNHNALAQAPAELGKPPATVIGTSSTYEGAKKIYEDAKTAHGGNYYYK